MYPACFRISEISIGALIKKPCALFWNSNFVPLFNSNKYKSDSLKNLRLFLFVNLTLKVKQTSSTAISPFSIRLIGRILHCFYIARQDRVFFVYFQKSYIILSNKVEKENKMGNFTIVTDGCIDFPMDVPKEVIELLTIVPLSFIIDGTPHIDAGEDRLTIEEFLDRTDKNWPTTSAPSPESFAKVFREIVSKGDQVLCITISGGLSATNKNAVIAAIDFPDDVRVIDSKSVSLGMYYLVEYAKELISKPLSLHRIAKKLERKTRDIKTFLLVKDLKNLKRGGRINNIQYLVSSLLSIKPLLQMDAKGNLQGVSKERTWKKAKEDMIIKILSLTDMPNVVKGGVIHVQNLEEARALADSLHAATGINFDIAETGVVITTHAGPGAIGIVVV